MHRYLWLGGHRQAPSNAMDFTSGGMSSFTRMGCVQEAVRAPSATSRVALHVKLQASLGAVKWSVGRGLDRSSKVAPGQSLVHRKAPVEQVTLDPEPSSVTADPGAEQVRSLTGAMAQVTGRAVRQALLTR